MPLIIYSISREISKEEAESLIEDAEKFLDRITIALDELKIWSRWKMLEGIEIKQLRRFADAQGFFTEILRKDWQLLEAEIQQTNFSISYPGIVRAWHWHLIGQVDCFVVLKFLKGALKICAYDDEYKKSSKSIGFWVKSWITNSAKE